MIRLCGSCKCLESSFLGVSVPLKLSIHDLLTKLLSAILMRGLPASWGSFAHSALSSQRAARNLPANRSSGDGVFGNLLAKTAGCPLSVSLCLNTPLH